MTANSWQITILVLVFSFRKQLTNVIERLKTASATSVDFYEQQNVPTSSIENIANLKGVSVNGMQITDTYIDGRPKNHIVLNVEKSIVADLPKYAVEHQQPLLISEVAIARSFIMFERIYRDIFGSQIDILIKMMPPIGSLTIEEADNEFQKNVTKHPDFYKSDQFIDWLRFLENSGLVSRNTNDKSVAITNFGLDFLNYLDNRNYTKEKNF